VQRYRKRYLSVPKDVEADFILACGVHCGPVDRRTADPSVRGMALPQPGGDVQHGCGSFVLRGLLCEQRASQGDDDPGAARAMLPNGDEQDASPIDQLEPPRAAETSGLAALRRVLDFSISAPARRTVVAGELQYGSSRRPLTLASLPSSLIQHLD
jgi:hypothetical protein